MEIKPKVMSATHLEHLNFRGRFHVAKRTARKKLWKPLGRSGNPSAIITTSQWITFWKRIFQGCQRGQSGYWALTWFLEGRVSMEKWSTFYTVPYCIFWDFGELSYQQIKKCRWVHGQPRDIMSLQWGMQWCQWQWRWGEALIDCVGQISPAALRCGKLSPSSQDLLLSIIKK